MASVDFMAMRPAVCLFLLLLAVGNAESSPNDCHADGTCSQEDMVFLLQSTLRSESGLTMEESRKAEEGEVSSTKEEWPDLKKMTDWVGKVDDKAKQLLNDASHKLATAVNVTLDKLEEKVDDIVAFTENSKKTLVTALNTTKKEKLQFFNAKSKLILEQASAKWMEIKGLVRAVDKTVAGSLKAAGQTELAINVNNTFASALLQAESFATMLSTAAKRVSRVVMANASEQLTKVKGALDMSLQIALEFIKSFQDAFEEFMSDLTTAAKEKLPEALSAKLIPTLHRVKERAGAIVDKLKGATESFITDVSQALVDTGVPIKDKNEGVRTHIKYIGILLGFGVLSITAALLLRTRSVE